MWNKKIHLVSFLILLHCAKNNIETAAEASKETPQQNVQVNFEAKVGTAVFSCSTASYTNIGSSNSTVSPKDFRFYIHDLRLVKADGTEVTVTLTQDGVYQYKNLAFMDFENATSLCSAQGTSGTHKVVTGTIAASEALAFSKIRFRVGVPSDLNHLNAATQPAPLNVTYMFWTWTTGFKHFVAEFDTPNFTPFYAHVGSIDCTGFVPNMTCDYPNRPDIELSYTYGQTVVADAKQVYAGMDFTIANTASTQPGCHSDRTDPECKVILNNFGLHFTYTGSSTARGLTAGNVTPQQYNSPGQTVFRVE